MLNTVSSYSEITYVSAIKQPIVSGVISNNVALKPNAFVSAMVKVDKSHGLEYSVLDLEVSFLQSLTKTNRTKRSQTHNKGRAFYRGHAESLDTQIKNYIMSCEATAIIPILMINDMKNTIDRSHGDCAIQPMVRVHYTNYLEVGNILMSPEKMSGIIIETVGLSLLNSPSVTHVIDEIINNTTQVIVDSFIPSFKMIEETPSLTADIKRYLEFAYYGA